MIPNNHPRRKIVLTALLTIALVVLGYLAYNRYFSTKAQIKNASIAFLNSLYTNDQTKLNSLLSTSEKNSQEFAVFQKSLGRQTTKVDSITVSSVVIKSKTTGVSGRVKFHGDDKDTDGTPYVLRFIQENGSWKIDLFNIGLITPDGQ